MTIGRFLFATVIALTSRFGNAYSAWSRGSVRSTTCESGNGSKPSLAVSDGEHISM